MSDLELVLRHRLEQVKKGVHIGSARLQAAQDARGMSNEGIARQLFISERTWRRWKEEGEIPAYHLDGVARVLELRIERPGENHENGVSRGEHPDTLARLEERVAGVEEVALETRDLLRALLAQNAESVPASPAPRRAKQR